MNDNFLWLNYLFDNLNLFNYFRFRWKSNSVSDGSAIAYRIAFPPEPKIIEKVEVVEKVIEPQKIIIQTPAGSIATKNADLSIQKGQGLNKFFGKSGGDVAGGVTDAPTTGVDEDTVGEDGSVILGGNESDAEGSKGVKRTVHTFTNVNAREYGFINVVSGWRWGKVTDLSLIHISEPTRPY